MSAPDMPNAVPFGDAQIGQAAYTWESADGTGWGDYIFETVDPLTVYDPYDFNGDPLKIIRKRWVLTAVDEFSFNEPPA